MWKYNKICSYYRQGLLVGDRTKGEQTKWHVQNVMDKLVTTLVWILIQLKSIYI